jgi:hypothetical protein
MVTESAYQQDSRHYRKQIRLADRSTQSALFLSYCIAAIAECERGELSLWQVGAQTLGLIGSMETPPVKLFSVKLTSSQQILDELHGVAGSLDMAGQGGTTKEADEKLWQQYKELVDKYEASLKS